jgi:hypothetical protein
MARFGATRKRVNLENQFLCHDFIASTVSKTVGNKINIANGFLHQVDRARIYQVLRKNLLNWIIHFSTLPNC